MSAEQRPSCSSEHPIVYTEASGTTHDYGRRMSRDQPSESLSPRRSFEDQASHSAATSFRAPVFARDHRAITVGIEAPPFPPGEISVDNENEQPVLHLAGEIDTVVVQVFEQSIGYSGHDPDERYAFAVVDVSAVTFIDASGLSFLVRQTKATSDSATRPVLRRAPAQVKKLLKVTGLQQLFDYAS
jgi:anti-anti-sigma factor